LDAGFVPPAVVLAAVELVGAVVACELLTVVGVAVVADFELLPHAANATSAANAGTTKPRRTLLFG
jgi:hypothetical protein